MYQSCALKGILAILAAATLSACASGYSQFYRQQPGVTPEMIAERRAGPPPAAPQVERRAAPTDVQGFHREYLRMGYVSIGNVAFESGDRETDAAAVEQGKKVGADLVVIFAPRYVGSTTTAVPLTLPTTTTTYSSGSATAYGPGGTAQVFGSGTSTTYGTTTTMIPMTVHRSNYGAVYFVRLKWNFGATYRPLNESERQELQSNRGVAIQVVVDKTPAYQADLLSGDIIVAVDGQSITDHEDLTQALRNKDGQTVSLTVVRRGARIEKVVQLNP